jgi:two-component system, OmpR family, phosphate regulon sensor histidine kinase PhoR
MHGHLLWTTSSRRLTILLLAVVLPPAATLVWLGAQLLQQDRAVFAQREQDRRIAVGGAVAAELARLLSSAERLPDDGAGPEGIARFILSADRLDLVPRSGMLWTPTPNRLPHADERVFDEPTRLEYQGDPRGALTHYERLVRSSDRAVRAGALRRMARVHWRVKDFDAALAVSRALTELRDVSDLGMPADLLARRNICDILMAAGRAAALKREADQLENDLLSSTWSLDRDSWDLVASDIATWRGAAVPAREDQRLFSAVADTLWREFQRGDYAPGQSEARVVDIGGTPVTVVSRSSVSTTTVVAIAPVALQAWSRAAVAGAFADAARLAVLAPSGRVLAGMPAPADTPLVRVSAADSGLPWTVILHSDRWSKAGEQDAYRRRLMMAGLASILLLLAGGSYFLWHVVQREMAVSRLQTDFVAAVSHEFRTPLTSLRHVTELLEEDDQMPPERRRSFYEVYRRNTERLHQLVESLLDFARMEAGRKAYDRRPLDAAALATHVVAEFERQTSLAGGRFALDVSGAAGLQLLGDRDALVNALWNLLDNAVKYSPHGTPVQVHVGAHPGGIAFEIRDRGLGISRQERQAVFQRFVRGKQAVERGIKGTGLGLAMVAHIARAHGGVVEVESEEGLGSTFRLIVPRSRGATDHAPNYEPA